MNHIFRHSTAGMDAERIADHYLDRMIASRPGKGRYVCIHRHSGVRYHRIYISHSYLKYWRKAYRLVYKAYQSEVEKDRGLFEYRHLMEFSLSKRTQISSFFCKAKLANDKAQVRLRRHLRLSYGKQWPNIPNS